VKVYDANHLAPYAHLFDQWVGYDDEHSLNEKIKYIKNKGLGGWMVWNMDLDDFGGVHCDVGSYPLIKAANQALLGHIPSESFSTITTTKRPTTPYTGPSTTPTIPPGGSGFCADKQNGLHKNPESCTSYYNCFGGNGELMYCGLGDLIFDPDKGYCNYFNECSPERRAECT
jgi:chitinase